MVFIANIVKKVNNPFVIPQSRLHDLPKSHVFSSMPLQSGIFTINRNFIIGLVSSIITAAMGYGIRFILFNYLEYDVFTNLDNWRVSLSYFCYLGGIRFVINEYLKENTFLMSYCGGGGAVPNNTAGGKLAGYNSPMQAFGPSITEDRSMLEQKIRKVQEKVQYFSEQLEAANQDLYEVEHKKPLYLANGKEEEWKKEYLETLSAIKDTKTNLSSESRMQSILQKRLEDGYYSTSDTSATTKRRFSDCSMAKDDSSTPTNTKRTADDR
jgi:hypothetical protein